MLEIHIPEKVSFFFFEKYNRSFSLHHVSNIINFK